MVTAEWPFLATCPAWLWWDAAAPSLHQPLAWAGLATTWAGVERILLPDPHILLQGSCSSAQEPVGGFSQCSAGVPGQPSGEEVSGHPRNLVEIPFFSVICFWACSHFRTAATSLMLFDDKECNYFDLFHMLLLFSSPNLKSDSPLRKNIFLFRKVLSLPCLSILSSFHRVNNNTCTPSEGYVFKPYKNTS